MATGSDMRKTNCAGGFVPNFRGSVRYNEDMDRVDNPHILSELRGVHDLSVTKRSYPPPPDVKTGLDHLPKNCAPSESGFTRARSSHAPDAMDVLRAQRARNIMSNNIKDKLDAHCRVPQYMATSETHEQFSPGVLQREKPDWMAEFGGSKDSGFIHAFGPNTLDGRHMDPIYSGSPPDMGRVGPSTTHQDYLPYPLRSGKEFTLPISYTGRTLTGFNRFKELNPCYSDHSWKGPCRDFETSYTHDYYKKTSHCDTHGKQIVGKGFNISKSAEDINLFGGPGYYITEHMDRYTSPLLEGRARHGHLRGAVDNFNQTNGFIIGTKVHNPFIDPCKSSRMDDRSDGPLDPTRYNPWPRYLVGHRGMLNKNYRPHPVFEADTQYDLLRIENGSIFKDYPALN